MRAFAPDCDHDSVHKQCRFFRFSLAHQSPKRRLDWKNAVRRLDLSDQLKRKILSPAKHSRLCSCHFEGQNSKKSPIIFERSEAKRFLFKLSENNKRQQKRNKPEKSVNDRVIEVAERLSKSPENRTRSPSRQLDETYPEHCVATPNTSRDVGFDEQHTNEEITLLKVDNILLAEKVKTLEAELEKVKAEQQVPQTFSLNRIQSNDSLLAHYIGLPSIDAFHLLLSLYNGREINYYLKWKVTKLSKEDQLLICLMKLRQNFLNIDLALRFGVSKGTVTNTVLTWISALHIALVEGLMSKVPSRYKNQKSLPKCFAQYSSCKMVIDCTEIFAANPKKMSLSNAMYSSYKHRITLKALVGVAPNGTVTFSSKLYPGSTSDKAIVADCGVLEKFELGDLVIADKGFLIGDLPQGVNVNIPAFKDLPQFTEAQVLSRFAFAQARIHVERAIQRIKSFRILDFIPANYVPIASQVFQVCCALTSFKPPLLKEISSML